MSGPAAILSFFFDIFNLKDNDANRIILGDFNVVCY